MDAYYAHSGTVGDYRDWQLLRLHLQAVARLTASRAAEAIPADGALAAAAWAAGLLHDLGKYRPEFQQYLRGVLKKGDPLTYHKQAGAAKALFDAEQWPVALAVLGHHGGMPDGASIKADLRHDAGKPVADAVWPHAVRDCPDLVSLQLGRPQFSDPYRFELFTRLLFSCLVDADWTDTGEHERQRKGWPAEPGPPGLSPELRLAQVLTHIAGRAAQCAEPHIRDLRAAILEACLAAADETPRLFSLTVPTGGGKTLASLAFALRHASRHALRRVIYVAPYMSILEQNAGVFRAALQLGPVAPDLFEHYSLAEPPGDQDMNATAREAAARRAENWDAPLVVTTNVQFFESLFSNRPGRCRKLHNIARSVIILDECQTLPPGLVAPSCAMLKQLVSDLGCTVVLCTATQPAFDHASLAANERLDAREIMPPSLDLFGQLRRVRISWPKLGDAPMSWSEVAERMRREPSALCVVNTKKAARAVYEELKQANTLGVFHLSTAMCPAHRRAQLAVVRQRLATGVPCYVVSTQLIEAGVDVDFPFVMRELAPLEAIIQAAGRCNREGRIKGAGGTVVVFRSAEGNLPPDRWYRAGRDALSVHFLARGLEPQIDDPQTIRDYYGRLYYSGNLDDGGIQAMRPKLQFKQVAEAYRLIEAATEPVVISRWPAHQAEIDALLAEVRERPRKAVFRALAQFQVNLFAHQLVQLAHLVHQEPRSGIWVWDGGYDDGVGIVEEMADAFII